MSLIKKIKSKEVEVTPIKMKEIETILPNIVITWIFPYPTVTYVTTVKCRHAMKVLSPGFTLP